MKLESTMRMVNVQVNGYARKAVVRNADTLLYMLREHFGLTGAKPGCENGDCGSCAVLVDGKTIHACHMLAVETENRQVTTIEGLQYSPVQNAFIDKWAVQCGYCTPGFIVNCHSLIMNHTNPDDETIRDWLGSNLCRCTGYEEIREVVNALLERKST